MVRGFQNGISCGNGITASATKVRWEDRPEDGALDTWQHEFGHRVGMVACGNRANDPAVKDVFHPNPVGILPDAPSKLYGHIYKKNSYGGHQGPHCGSGALTINTTTNVWSGKPDCIMFGSNGTSSRDVRHSDYCA